MKTDLERICKVARMGGCECEPYNGFGREWLISFIRNDHVETIRDIDAVVRPEMLRAFTKTLPTTKAGYRRELYIDNDIFYADDRIAWVIKHIVEPIEETLRIKNADVSAYSE